MALRLAKHPILGPRPSGQRVTFTFNGEPVAAEEGEPIAVALLAAGHWVLRRADKGATPRGLYCGMGHCYECRVTVDGVPNVRACLTPVRAGMQVEG